MLAINKQEEEEIKRLKTQSNDLKVRGVKEDEKIDALEQYGRRLDLEIAGVPVRDKENTNDIVAEIAKLANVDISADRIFTSHRLAAERKHAGEDENSVKIPPPIIVRFIGRDIRNNMYANRQNLRHANLNNFSIAGTTNLFINENLTNYRKKLFWNAKQKVKGNHYKYIWTSNGNIFVKKSDESQPRMIKTDKDLEAIK